MSKKKKEAFTDASQKTTSLDVRLVANVGDEVYYLRPQIATYTTEDGKEKLKITVHKERIVKGIVCNINSADTRVFMRINREDGYKEASEMAEFLQSTEVESLQEFFFTTLEEAENAVDKLNAHTDFEIRTWAEDFRTFMNVAYPYKLCFSVEAGQTIERMVRRLNYRHERILVEDVYANINIDSRNTSIHYRGRTTSSEVSKPKFEGEYKIVKEKKKH